MRLVRVSEIAASPEEELVMYGQLSPEQEAIKQEIASELLDDECIEGVDDLPVAA